MELQKLSLDPPPGAREFLLELEAGEFGFGGTSFGRGLASLEDYLQSCLDAEVPAKVEPGFVPQFTYWLIDEGRIVGMVRIRPHLNERLLQSGGNIGYYVRPGERGKGYAQAGLRLALANLHQLGIARALVTVSPSNLASIGVVLACGGVLDGTGCHPETAVVVNRYWIETSQET